jgi:CelD/BcsL family acetyltransferase involved in cellulose biosynthesis
MADTQTGIHAFVASSIEELEPHLAAWDRLAVNAARPMMRPAWLLAWWGGLRASGISTELRVVIAYDGRGLAGLLPMHAERPSKGPVVHHMLGSGGVWGLGALLRPEAPGDTVQRIAQALGASTPRPRVIDLDAVDASDGWTAQLASSWPGRGAHVYVRGPAESLAIETDGGFTAWLGGTRWKGEYGRTLRRLAERGVALRKSNPSTFSEDLAELFRLHRERWNGRSRWLSPAIRFALENAGGEFCASGAVRLWSLRSAERAVGASLFAAAGGESCFLMIAYDPAWRSFGPGIATAIAGIEESFTLGEALVDLGHGGFEYKRELANYARPLSWLRIFPREAGYGRVRARWAPRHARERMNRLRVELRLRSRMAELRAARAGRQAI